MLLPRVGFIGAGAMGGPMVERLLQAGVPVHLYARRHDARRRFAELGATVARSIADVARSANPVILCPFSEPQLDAILAAPDGVLAHAAPGTVVVQHATVSAGGITRISADAARAGIAVLDAPISGGAEEVRAGALTVLVGGERAALDRVEPVLRRYSGTVVYTGAVGTATLAKLVNNLTFAAHVQLAGATVELGERLGMAPADLLAALTACSANSFALSALHAAGDVVAFAERAAPYLRKDVELAERVASGLGAELGLLGEVVRTGRFDLTG